MYLSELTDRTVLLLTGHALGAVTPACEMARGLAPAMLVLEDVDLVAENRMHGHSTSLLFELLNQMDGLSEDTDIVFVLTTNRPEVIEPALASRPGRIDLAVSMPLPDAEGRSRLPDLYGARPATRPTRPDAVRHRHGRHHFSVHPPGTSPGGPVRRCSPCGRRPWREPTGRSGNRAIRRLRLAGLSHLGLTNGRRLSPRSRRGAGPPRLRASISATPVSMREASTAGLCPSRFCSWANARVSLPHRRGVSHCCFRAR
jgi:hypothetical protein